MEAIISYVTTHWVEIIEGYLALVGLASWVVKMTPTLADDHILKAIIAFIGKFIAADKYGPKG